MDNTYLDYLINLYWGETEDDEGINYYKEKGEDPEKILDNAKRLLEKKERGIKDAKGEYCTEVYIKITTTETKGETRENEEYCEEMTHSCKK
jgi:hypothetical protein